MQVWSLWPLSPLLSQHSSLCSALTCELSESDRCENTEGQECEKGGVGRQGEEAVREGKNPNRLEMAGDTDG